jgi:hypothetical protein
VDYQENAWLFMRGEQSIRVTRAPSGARLLTFGPGEAHQAYDFAGNASLEQFLQEYQQRLLDDGWLLAIVSERRQSEKDVPPHQERRARERRKKPRD